MAVSRGFLGVLILLGATLSVPLGTAQEASPYTYSQTDPAGDSDDYCTAVFSGGPCDVVRVQAGVTATEFLVLWTVNGFTWPAYGASQAINFRLWFKDPAGTAHKAAVAVSATGTVASPSFTGDPAAVAGATFVVDRTAKTVLVKVPLASVKGVAPGAAFEFTQLTTQHNPNAGVAAGGLWTTADTVAPGGKVVVPTSGGTAGGSASSAVVTTYHAVQDSDLRASRHANASVTATDVYNWSSPGGELELSYSYNVGGGTANLTLVDGSNTTVATANLTGVGNLTRPLNNVTDGVWSLRVNYANFTGSLVILVQPATPAETPSGTGTNGTQGQQVATETDGLNATMDSSGSFPLLQAQKAPGPALPIALVLLFGLVFIRRRWA